MQRCPKCGYRERFDWSLLLLAASCGVLYVALMLVQVDVVPRSYRIWVSVAGFFGFFMCIAGILGRAYRRRMEDLEYSRSHELAKLD